MDIKSFSDTDVFDFIKEMHRHRDPSPELIEHNLNTDFNLGRPQLLPKPNRGRQSKKTQYDQRYERVRDYRRRLFHLPKLRLGMKYVPDGLICDIADSILQPRGRAKKIQRELELRGHIVPDVSTIRKVLKNRGR